MDAKVGWIITSGNKRKTKWNPKRANELGVTETYSELKEKETLPIIQNRKVRCWELAKEYWGFL